MFVLKFDPAKLGYCPTVRNTRWSTKGQALNKFLLVRLKMNRSKEEDGRERRP